MPPHFVDGGGDPRLALVEIDRSPVLVLLGGPGNRGYGLVVVDAGGPGIGEPSTGVT